jgi:hypothetical protein
MDFRPFLLRVALPLVAFALKSEAQGIRGVTRRTPTVVHGQNASQFFAAGGVPLNAPTNVGGIPGSPQAANGAGLAQQARPFPQGPVAQPGYAAAPNRLPAGIPSRTPATMSHRQPQGPSTPAKPAAGQRPLSPAVQNAAPTRKPAPPAPSR